jgi:hypothetical protein
VNAHHGGLAVGNLRNHTREIDIEDKGH